MKQINTNMAMILAGGALLIALSAGAATLATQQAMQPDSKPVARSERVIVRDSAPAPVTQARAPACDDGNVVGNILGGTAGGIAGSQIGSGSGQTAATIAGTLGGAYLGGEYIPTQNATCP